MLAVFPSALGRYWATSNVVTIAQAIALNVFVKRRDGRLPLRHETESP